MKVVHTAIRVILILILSMSILWVLRFSTQIGQAETAPPVDSPSWHLASITFNDDAGQGRPKYTIIEEVKKDATGGYARIAFAPSYPGCQGHVQRFRFVWRFDEDASRIYVKRPLTVRVTIEGNNAANDPCLARNPFMGVDALGNSFEARPGLDEGRARIYYQPPPNFTNTSVRQIFPISGAYPDNSFRLVITGFGPGDGTGFYLHIDYNYKGDTGAAPPPPTGGGNPSSGHQSCFAPDPGAGSTDRNAHYGYAQQQDAGRIDNNLKYKFGLLFQCSSVSDEQLANAFADISVIVARYVPRANCFGGDAGVTSTDRAGHLSYARGRNRQQVLNNLQWKVSSALKCLDRNGQIALFADVSVVVARAGA